jgi:hypothetical protein
MGERTDFFLSIKIPSFLDFDATPHKCDISTRFQQSSTYLLYCSHYLEILAQNNLNMNKNGFVKEAVSRTSWIAMH